MGRHKIYDGKIYGDRTPNLHRYMGTEDIWGQDTKPDTWGQDTALDGMSSGSLCGAPTSKKGGLLCALEL